MAAPSRICSFALPLPVYHLFDYEVDELTDYQPGMRVELPFGNGKKLGILVSCDDHRPGHQLTIKQVIAKLDQEPVMSGHLQELAGWMADYYCQPLGEVLFQCIPRYLRKAELMGETRIRLWFAQAVDETTLNSLKSRAARQYELLQNLLDNPNGLNAAQLRAINNNWHQPIKALEKQGLVSSGWTENLPILPSGIESTPELTTDQSQILNQIQPMLERFQVHLIQGVTGSGKTEIYLALMQQIISAGQQVIYLVPEIGLTPQLLQRLQRRLGPAVVTSHSAQTEFQRYQVWDQFRRGAAQVMLGTRSSLFAEAENLGLIIIDEEHDVSYRQQDGIRYHARDVAIKRAQMLDIPVIMGSATPSLETLHNLSKAHYQLYRLERRVNQTQPPMIELIDCSHVVLKTGCSPQLLQAIEQHLANQGQVLLFLNRRGFAPVVMCHDCGWQAQCYQCDARMTLHQSMNQLICHHCGYRISMPRHCPDCGEQELKHYGIGTEQLENFLQQQFPAVDIIRIDRDSVSSSQQIEQKMQPVQLGKPCILVGTQMLAKGHDYPHITLVGILEADQALYSSFYRAEERLVQTVLQVSGRAGRAEKMGQALLQTSFPTHPLMQGLCQKSYSELVQPMLDERKLIGFPPYVRVVTFQADAIDLDLAIKKLQQVKQYLSTASDQSDVKIIGPIPALMARRVGRYRAQLSLMTQNFRLLRSILQQIMPSIQGLKNTAKSRLIIEVDPIDL